MTDWYRTVIPIASGISGVVILYVWRWQVGWLATTMVIALGYTIWFGWRLSHVWVDGDVLEVKGPSSGSFRVPLADVASIDRRYVGRGQRMLVLGLDHPVGKVQQVRFIPAGDAVETDLQARIHAARATRTVWIQESSDCFSRTSGLPAPHPASMPA